MYPLYQHLWDSSIEEQEWSYDFNEYEDDKSMKGWILLSLELFKEI